MERKIRLLIEYDGTAYAGWQIQPGDKPTIQLKIETAIELVTQSQSRIYCAGRTDAGVHAKGQVAHFYTESKIAAQRFAHAINSKLPPDITVLQSTEVEQKFDSRRDARGKIYRYTILNREMRPSLLRNRVWHLRYQLDLEAMKKAAALMEGEHDFKCFQASGCAAKTTVRCIYMIDIRKHENDLITIDVFATAFLKQMVRNIVGTLVEVGMGRMSVEHIAEVIESRDRSNAGPTAPACGLVMRKIFYSDDLPPKKLMDKVPKDHQQYILKK